MVQFERNLMPFQTQGDISKSWGSSFACFVSTAAEQSRNAGPSAGSSPGCWRVLVAVIQMGIRNTEQFCIFRSWPPWALWVWVRVCGPQRLEFCREGAEPTGPGWDIVHLGQCSIFAPESCPYCSHPWKRESLQCFSCNSVEEFYFHKQHFQSFIQLYIIYYVLSLECNDQSQIFCLTH